MRLLADYLSRLNPRARDIDVELCALGLVVLVAIAVAG